MAKLQTSLRFFRSAALISTTCAIVFASGCSNSEDSESLRNLDEELTHSERYDANKKVRIESLRHQTYSTDDPMQRIALGWELIRQYRSLQADSTAHHSIDLLEFGQSIHDTQAQMMGYIGLMDCFTSVGYFKEAADIAKLINPDSIPQDILPFYYNLSNRLYENLESYVWGSPTGIADVYRDKRIGFLTKEMELSTPNTYEHDAARIDLDQIKNPSADRAISERQELLDRYDVSEHEKAIQYSKMAHAALSKGYRMKAEEYLALSAINDIRSSTTETTALKMLAEMRHEDGDRLRAHVYIQKALKDADYFNSKLRKVEIGTVLPKIENERYNWRNSQMRTLILGLAALLILFFISIWLFIKLHSRNKCLHAAYEKLDRRSAQLQEQKEKTEILNQQKEEALTQLKETTAIKDRYIMESLYVNTGFVNSVEEKCKEISRLVKDKKYDELKFIGHQFGIKEERQRIYKAFDTAFMKLFPNFIDEINKLLPEEDPVEIPDSGELPMDIRIFALMRLGISDPAEVSRYLNLSTKTVYVYKTKLKSKSIVDNSQFEDRIMAIPKP